MVSYCLCSEFFYIGLQPILLNSVQHDVGVSFVDGRGELNTLLYLLLVMEWIAKAAPCGF